MEDEFRYFASKIFPKYILSKIAYPIYCAVRSLLRVIKRSRINKVTKQDLKADLQTAGIHPGDTIMLHSSLANIGNVDGGAETVIQSFIETVTQQGTILVPTYGVAYEVESNFKKGKIVDLRLEKSRSGTITERFRIRQHVFRSSHPFSSVCAWGKNAEYLTSGHADDRRICHPNSPFARFVELGGKVIGIGVNPGKVSVYHVIEDTWDSFPFKVYSEPFLIRYIDNMGEMITREVVKYDPLISSSRIDSPQNLWIRESLTKHLMRKRILNTFLFGLARSWIIDTKSLYTEMIRLAEKGITIYLTKNQWKAMNGGDESIDYW